MSKIQNFKYQITSWQQRFQNNPVHATLDAMYLSLTFIASLAVIFVLGFILFILFDTARPMFDRFGLSNIFGTKWFSDGEQFGFLPAIQGTLVTSIFAIIIAIPVSIGIAIFITEYIPFPSVQKFLQFTIELIAAIPSVIIGFWGLIVFLPFLKEVVTPVLIGLPIPYFSDPLVAGKTTNVFAAIMILIIMIVPIITTVSQSIISQVPQSQKEAAYALGATSYEMSRMVLLPMAKRGILGAVILGFGRAVGETMAVTMVIGNDPFAFASIFDAGSTITSIITNEWNEAVSNELQRAALLELALVLLSISLIVNLIARLLISRGSSTGTGRMEL